MPLIFEAFDWVHGVYVGATMGSEMTAAAVGGAGQVRRDPMAMLPFCGYNMGDYFAHWIKIGTKSDSSKLPKIFYVNWFRKDENGKFMWPGYGDNIRALKWALERVAGTGKYKDTPLGRIPDNGAFDVSGLDISADTLKKLFTVSKEEGLAEINEMREYYKMFGANLPKELTAELDAAEERFKKD
jgi:phosphoenolpyruvate carboxykinase (GTP)